MLTIRPPWSWPAAGQITRFTACKTKEAVKALLLRRHASWKQAQAEQNTRRSEEIGPALQLNVRACPETCLEVNIPHS